MYFSIVIFNMYVIVYAYMERRHLITNLVAGTAAATAAFHMAYDPPQIHWGPERETHTAEYDETSYGFPLRIAPDGIETDLFASSEASPIPYEAITNMEANPTTGGFDRYDMQSLADTLRYLSRSNYSQYRIVITPHISAEDNSGSADGGISTESLSNLAIAELKGQEMADFIRTTAGELDLDLPLIQVQESEEQLISDQSTMWDGETIIKDQLDYLVGEFGYDNPNDMIRRWRQAPADAPPEVRTTLRSIFNGQSFVDVKILTPEEEVCQITITHHKDVVERERDNEYPLPVAIPGYLPVVGAAALLSAGLRKRTSDNGTPREPRPPRESRTVPYSGVSGPGFGGSSRFGRRRRSPYRNRYSGRAHNRSVDYRRHNQDNSRRLRKIGAWVAGTALVLGLGYLGAEKWNDTTLTSDGTCVDIHKQPNTWGVSIHPHIGDQECSGTTAAPDYTPPRQNSDPCRYLPQETVDGGTIVRRFEDGELKSTQVVTP